MSPRFSILTPVYNPPADVLRATLASVGAQSYEGWEHCIADDGSTAPHVRPILEEAAAADPRVRVVYRPKSGGIVAATNDALALAQGEFIALLDHDDLLHPDALSHVSHALHVHPNADYVYTDEDKIDEEGNHYDLFLKPDWSPERFRAQMYTCHFSVLRKVLVDQVGGFRPGFDGSQDWDLVLRVTERARRVVHVRENCYHWRASAASAAGDDVAKPWAFESAKRAINDHLERTGFQGVVDDGEAPGTYRIRPQLQVHPVVGIVIPTAGHVRTVWGVPTTLVVNCVRSVMERTAYPNFEFVIVADTSMRTDVRDELHEIGGDRLRIVDFHRPFNFSEKVNLGVLETDAELLLLLNDDVEVLPDGWRDRWPVLDGGQSTWLDSLVMYGLRGDVGAVGARMYFSDLRIQHVGVVSHGGLPAHPYRGYPSRSSGYFRNIETPCNYLAVTAACLLTRRDVFDEVGGFSPTMPVNYNDVDFGLKLRRAGYRSVYDPNAELLHFESSTRAATVSEHEMGLIVNRWRSVLADDPYFHPRFFQSFPDFIAPPMLRDGTLLPM
jgi:GT2 family glycosyltransferase